MAVGNLREARGLLDTMNISYVWEAVLPEEEAEVKQRLKIPVGIFDVTSILIPSRGDQPAVIVFGKNDVYEGTYLEQQDKFVPRIRRMRHEQISAPVEYEGHDLQGLIGIVEINEGIPIRD